MQSLRHHVYSFGAATVDVVLAVLGVQFVLGPTAMVLHDLLGSPFPQPWILFGSVPLALCVAYPFVTRRLSLGWLGTYVWAFVAGWIAVGLLGVAVVIGFGIDLSGSDPRPQATLIAGAHAVALAVVSLSDVRLRGPVPGR